MIVMVEVLLTHVFFSLPSLDCWHTLVDLHSISHENTPCCESLNPSGLTTERLERWSPPKMTTDWAFFTAAEERVSWFWPCSINSTPWPLTLAHMFFVFLQKVGLVYTCDIILIIWTFLLSHICDIPVLMLENLSLYLLCSSITLQVVCEDGAPLRHLLCNLVFQ